jgi:hypothetical protein
MLIWHPPAGSATACRELLSALAALDRAMQATTPATIAADDAAALTVVAVQAAVGRQLAALSDGDESILHRWRPEHNQIPARKLLSECSGAGTSRDAVAVGGALLWEPLPEAERLNRLRWFARDALVWHAVAAGSDAAGVAWEMARLGLERFREELAAAAGLDDDHEPAALPDDLGEADRAIMQVATTEPQRGRDLARLAGYSYDHVRRLLPGLVGRGLLIRTTAGYRRPA